MSSTQALRVVERSVDYPAQSEEALGSIAPASPNTACQIAPCALGYEARQERIRVSLVGRLSVLAQLVFPWPSLAVLKTAAACATSSPDKAETWCVALRAPTAESTSLPGRLLSQTLSQRRCLYLPLSAVCHLQRSVQMYTGSPSSETGRRFTFCYWSQDD